MSSPQIENGYVRIATELLEALARTRIAGEARQVLDAVIRMTYGYQKKSDSIATLQLMEATGMDRKSVERARDWLRKANLITTHKKGGSQVLIYTVNKQYKTWKLPLKKGATTPKNRDEVPPKVPPSINNRYLSKDIKQGHKPAALVEKPVENPEVKKAMEEVMAEGLNIYAMLFKAKAQMKQPKDFWFPDSVILAVCAAYQREKAQIRNPWTWFLSVLQRESASWFANQNVQEHAVIKGQGAPALIGEIMRKVAERK